jgi:acyl dehydratase
MADATPEFKRQLRAAFAEMPVGRTFSFRRTFTVGDVALFCGVTGDFNPYHLDSAFIAESWFDRPIIPGLLTASMMTHLGGMIGFLATRMTFDYVAPVYVGDTITCVMTVTERDEAKRTVSGTAIYTNQDGKDVIQATFSGFPADVRLAH